MGIQSSSEVFANSQGAPGQSRPPRPSAERSSGEPNQLCKHLSNKHGVDEVKAVFRPARMEGLVVNPALTGSSKGPYLKRKGQLKKAGPNNSEPTTSRIKVA